MRSVLRFAFFTAILLSLNSCGAIIKGQVIKRTAAVEESIPPEFFDSDHTLICVLTGRNSRDKYMKKHIENEYTGNYVFVLREELEDPLYADTDTYRYLFDYEARQSSQMVTNPRTGTMRNSFAGSSLYFIKDRKTQLVYTNRATSGYFSKLIQGYVIGIENRRKEKGSE